MGINKTPEEIAREIVDKMKLYRYQIHTHECDYDAAVNLVTKYIRAERSRVFPDDIIEALKFYSVAKDNGARAKEVLEKYGY